MLKTLSAVGLLALTGLTEGQVCHSLTLPNGDSNIKWTDSKGKSCSWYGKRNRCAKKGNKRRNTYVANEACCECGGGATCSATRVRKAWSLLTCSERQEYVQAVKTLNAEQPDEYRKLVVLHDFNFGFAHGTSSFLPWHRWYILAYENAIRSLRGFECLTLPYWDWERDAQSREMSSVLRAETFGAYHSPSETCVSDGIGAGWSDHNIENVGCLNRNFGGFGSRGFTGSLSMRELITSNPSYETWRPTFEGNPHAAPHNWVGGDMSSAFSPADPLFWLHHANVDRMWGIWQDYNGYDEVSKDDLDPRLHYVASPATSEHDLDSTMPFTVDGRGTESEYLRTPVTIRDMHNMMNLPGGHSVVYGNDNLVHLIGAPAAGSWNWFTAADEAKLTCCGDGTVDENEQCDDGNVNDNDGCSSSCLLEGSSAVALPPTVPMINQVSSNPIIQQAFERMTKEIDTNGGNTAAMWLELAWIECTETEAEMKNISPVTDEMIIRMGMNPATDRQLFTPCGILPSRNSKSGITQSIPSK